MFDKNNKKGKIGDVLVEKKLITKQDLLESLNIQKSYGSKVGKVLMGEGKIRAFQFYRALAEQLGMEFVDLNEEPCDEVLIETDERENYLRFHAVPWKKDDKTIIIATSDMTPEMEYWAESKYGNVDYIITSSFDIFRTVQEFFAKEDDEEAREKLWKESPEKSAKYLFSTSLGRNIILASISLFIAALFSNIILKTIFIVFNIFYLSTLLCKILFFFTGALAEKYNKKKKADVEILDERALPVYTLLVPLYKEKRTTISGLVDAIRRLDYPKSHLDVKLIIEEDDNKTLFNIKEIEPESYFEVIKVPYSEPRTKPKACNYALKFARGDYVAIYDAEDRPDPQQLRKVLARFQASDENVVCVQSRLNYYNRNENVLTKMFSLEYSSWFNFMLPGLEYMKMPIPLGGTSNHFNKNKLEELGAWDPYNVTEDADLGIRLAQSGYKTSMIDSTTLEESPVSLGGWIKQRSRWIKGYMQTYIVHSRNTPKIIEHFGISGFLGFLFFVGAPSLVFLTIPVILFLAVFSLYHGISYPDWFMQIAMINLFGGILIHAMIAMIVIARDKWWNLSLYAFVFPFYWILHSIASFKALWQLIAKPHYWEKTEHGVSKHCS